MSISRARRLRQDLTDAERLLWSRLRRNRLEEWHFRRQAPIGPYTVDFACVAAGLVIEVDGGQHAAQREKDAARTAYLEARGYRVIRFWNNEVIGNLDGVLEVIRAALPG